MARKAKTQDSAQSMGGQEVPLSEQPEDEGVGGSIVAVNHNFIEGGPDGTCRDCELPATSHPDGDEA